MASLTLGSTISVEDREFVRKMRKLRRKDIPKAMRDALNDSGKSAHKGVLKGLASEFKVPQKAFKPKRSRRGRVIKSKASLRKLRYRIWMGYIPLSAMSAGKPRQLRRGVRAGRYFFEDAFVHQTGSRRGVVFQRVGDERLPLDVPRIKLENADRIVKRESKKAFKKRFGPAMNRQLKRYARLR